MVSRLSAVGRAGHGNGVRKPRKWSVGWALEVAPVALQPASSSLLPASVALRPVFVALRPLCVSFPPAEKEPCNLASCCRPSMCGGSLETIATSLGWGLDLGADVNWSRLPVEVFPREMTGFPLANFSISKVRQYPRRQQKKPQHSPKLDFPWLKRDYSGGKFGSLGRSPRA